MLIIDIPEMEAFNEKTNKFIKLPARTLKLEHSLLSLAKWEGKHHKYFIDNKELNADEILDYIKCMTINDVEDYIYDYLSADHIKQITEYMKNPMTATWFSDDGKGSRNHEIITAEVIYSSMIILGIPVELFEKRHLNHLLTLIRVCNEKQNPESKSNKKMNSYDTAKYYSELNKARKAKLGTRG